MVASANLQRCKKEAHSVVGARLMKESSEDCLFLSLYAVGTSETVFNTRAATA